MLTFDDGYMSNYVYAAPLLREYGFTAVIFTITSQIAQEGSAAAADQAIPQTKDMMEASQDVFTYASHTDNLHTAVGSGPPALQRLGQRKVAVPVAALNEGDVYVSGHLLQRGIALSSPESA